MTVIIKATEGNIPIILFMKLFKVVLSYFECIDQFFPVVKVCFSIHLRWSRDGAVLRALASHQCEPGSWTRCHMWVEFVVGSRPCSERFFSRYSGFPLSSKPNISKFQFDLESVPN